MLPIDQKISLLVHLSKVDNHVAKEESDLIHTIGKRNGLTEDMVENIIDNPLPVGKLDNLPEDEKFEHLFNIIQLMKIDRKVYQKEIEFCERIAVNLGYKPGVIADMSAYIYSDPSVQSNPELLKDIAKKHLV